MVPLYTRNKEAEENPSTNRRDLFWCHLRVVCSPTAAYNDFGCGLVCTWYLGFPYRPVFTVNNTMRRRPESKELLAITCHVELSGAFLFGAPRTRRARNRSFQPTVNEMK